MLTPGSYLRLRRAAAGHTVQTAAAALAALPIAVGGTERTRAAILEAMLLRVEANLAFLRPQQSLIVRRAFPFDTNVYEQLAILHCAGAGSGLPIPQVCRTCGCSWFDPCMADSGPCSWSEHDAELCTVCHAAADHAGAVHAHAAHQPIAPAGREVAL